MPDEINTATGQDTNTQAQGGNSANNQQSSAGNNGIDYEKIQSMIDK